MYRLTSCQSDRRPIAYEAQGAPLREKVHLSEGSILSFVGFLVSLPVLHSGSGARIVCAMEESASTANGSGYAPRDRDPPPSFDGSSPDDLKQFLRDLELWQWESDIPKVKHAVKVLRQLSGSARAAADEISVEDLKKEDGVSRIVRKLKEHFQPHLESAMPKAFERAVYGEARKSRETMQDYIIRLDKAFKELGDEGVKLGEDVRGYIIFRQAALSQTQEDQVTTWTQGKYDRETVVRALRRLEKVQKDKGGKSFLVEEGLEGDGDETFGVWAPETDREIEDFVYMLEGDMDQIFEEDGLHDALATYQQVRKALRDQRTSRGWSKGGKGGGRISVAGSNNKIGFQLDRGSKVHVESLKLRTKCARCGVVGHWARECTNAPDQFARNRQGSSNGSGSGGQAKGSYQSSMSGRSGFVHVGEVSESNQGLWMEGQSKIFVETNNDMEFVGVTTHGAFGLVDTAAQSGLIGEGALSRLQVALNSFGLKVKKTDKKAQARGVGGEAKVQGVVEIPMGLGGVNGVLEATVVQEDVPLLIPVRLLRDLRAVIDFSKEQVQLMKYDRSTPMTILPSGHASVSIVDFASEGWSLPIEAKVRGMREEDFMIEGQHAPRTREAMPAWSNLFVTSPQRNVSLFADGGVASSAAGNAEEGRRGGELYGHVAHGKEGQNGLDGAGRKGFGGDQNSRSASSTRSSRPANARGGLAQRWLSAWILGTGISGCGATPIADLSRAFQEAARVGSSNEGWNAGGTSKVSDATSSCNRDCTHPPSSLTAAGNQYQREVWCQDCHARWKVSTVAREASKQSVHVASTPLNPNNTWGGLNKFNVDTIPSKEDNTGTGDEVHLQQAGSTLVGEEGWSNERKAFLPMPCSSMRVLPMGSNGAEGAAREGGSGGKLGESGSESGSQQDEGRDGGSKEGSRDEGVRFEDQGGADPADPAELEPRSTESGEHRGSTGRGSTPRSVRFADSAVPDSTSNHAGSALLDDSPGRRRKDWRSDEESRGECPDLPKGGGSEEPNGAVRGDASDEVRGASSKSVTGLEEREAAEERGPSEVEKGRREEGKKGRRVGGKKEQCFWARDEELSVIAPWALKVSAGKEWNTAVKRQIEDEYKPKDQAMIQTGFWSKDQSGYWKFHNGILPTHAPSGGALVAMSAEEHDEEEDEEGGQLKRGLRKRLQRAMREVVVSEVFSAPRVAPIAKELGLKQGSSIDLMNGFDLTQEKDRRRCWKRLRDEDPDLVVLCPPCGPFSALQNLNYPKMSFEKGMALLGEGVQHVEFAMRIYEWQVRRGKKAIFEHPATSKAWEEESVQRVLQLPGVVRIRGDQCEYGLRVGEDDQPAKKPTDFMVNGEGMARALSRRCQGNHTHVPLVNGKAKGAQRYPKELCEAMVKGFQEDWKGKLTAVVCFVDCSRPISIHLSVPIFVLLYLCSPTCWMCFVVLGKMAGPWTKLLLVNPPVLVLLLRLCLSSSIWNFPLVCLSCRAPLFLGLWISVVICWTIYKHCVGPKSPLLKGCLGLNSLSILKSWREKLFPHVMVQKLAHMVKPLCLCWSLRITCIRKFWPCRMLVVALLVCLESLWLSVDKLVCRLPDCPEITNSMVLTVNHSWVLRAKHDRLYMTAFTNACLLKLIQSQQRFLRVKPQPKIQLNSLLWVWTSSNGMCPKTGNLLRLLLVQNFSFLHPWKFVHPQILLSNLSFSNMMFLSVETDGCAGCVPAVQVLRMDHGLKRCVAFVIFVMISNFHIRVLRAANVEKPPAMKSRWMENCLFRVPAGYPMKMPVF